MTVTKEESVIGNKWYKDAMFRSDIKADVYSYIEGMRLGKTMQLVVQPASIWVPYNWNIIESRPTEYGKYFVMRKDGKVHWETWNGSGWAYNGNVITHWAKIILPEK